MANRNFASAGKIYSMHVMPVLLDCNFVVDSTNGNGLGIRNLKGPAVSAVYMHTSATPAAGNPNPGTGVIILQLADNYNRYFGGFSGTVSALGSASAAITANTTYVIESLGTTTAAQWVTAGVPANMLNLNGLPQPGLAFVAATSETIPGSPLVAPIAAAGSGIDHIEIVGDPNVSISPLPISSTGGQIILQCFSGGVQTAPANGSVISLSTYLSNSSITIQGE